MGTPAHGRRIHPLPRTIMRGGIQRRMQRPISRRIYFVVPVPPEPDPPDEPDEPAAPEESEDPDEPEPDMPDDPDIPEPLELVPEDPLAPEL